LKRIGDKTELCGTPACITLGVDISPYTETLNFLCERNEPISLKKLVENSNLENLYSKPVSFRIKGFFNVQEHRRRRHVIVKIKGSVVL
jgi:hypothetical protein